VRKINSTYLSVMSDDHLDRLCKNIKYKIYNLNESIKNKSVKRSNRDVQRQISDFQTDYCYIAREVEIRESRKSAHQAYLSNVKKIRRT